MLSSMATILVSTHRSESSILFQVETHLLINNRSMAAETVRRGDFKGWRVMRSFQEAFHVMVTKAEKNTSGIEIEEGDDEDCNIDELPGKQQHGSSMQ